MTAPTSTRETPHDGRQAADRTTRRPERRHQRSRRAPADAIQPAHRDAAASGLPSGFGLHGLRRYFATTLIHAGGSVKVVQLALGHANPMITLNTYVHERPGQDERWKVPWLSRS